MQNLRGQLLAIFILTLVAVFVALPLDNKPKIPLLSEAKMELGIDLAGGAELTYRALYPSGGNLNKTDTLQKIVYVLSTRVNKRGLKEPRINSAGDEMIQIQLAGIDKDVLTDYKKLIETAGKLELHEVADKETMKRFNENGVVPSDYIVKDSRDHRSESHEIKDRVLLKVPPILDGSDIADATPGPTQNRGQFGMGVHFRLNLDGGKRFDSAAARLFKGDDSPDNGMICIVLDGEIQSMPTVNTSHFGGGGTISGGNFTQESANTLAITLKSGSLPVPIGRRVSIKNPDGSVSTKDEPKIPEAENFVGPSLGQDSIRRGMIASVLSLIVVSLFMVVYYRLPGVISILGLFLNIVWLLAIMAMMGATMTLPGIAGIVLTMGMAVDANILIYERVREEMELGRSALQAFEAGYERAFVTIVDSNLTTLLAGVVLYYFGTGAIQGFAVTLSLGIITTLVSVLWGCKVMLRMLVQAGTITDWKMMRLFKKTSINFTGMIGKMAVVSLVVTIGGMSVFIWRGEEQYDIDFTGGSVVNFAFAEQVDINQVRSFANDYSPDGKEKPLSDAQIQTIVEPGTDIKTIRLIAAARSRQFQLRDKAQEPQSVRKHIQDAFSGATWKGPALSHEPFADIEKKDVPDNERWSAPKDGTSGAPGGGLWVYLRDDGKLDLGDTAKKLTERLKKNGKVTLTRDVNDEPIFGGDAGPLTLAKAADSPKGLAKVKVLLCRRDTERPSDDNIRKLREEFKEAGKEGVLALSVDPFTSATNIGASVASELWTSTIWALIVAWIGIIIYVAVRFHQTPFGVAGVIALIHDCFVAIGVTSIAGLVVPKSWGLNFDFNMSTVAAVLTVIGYSINDTIVVFDRIRENMAKLKTDSFAEIINTSINETLSRTVLTSFTVFLTCLVLYLFTMTSSGGIASFAFPMLIGVITGTFSSIFIAAPILLYWYKGHKPQVA